MKDDNHERSMRALRVIAKQACGLKVYGKRTEIKMGFDAANPPGQDKAADTLNQVGKLLGIKNPADPDEWSQALASLLEAAGVTDDSAALTDDGAEGMPPTQPKRTGVESPKVVKQNLIQRGKRMLGWR